MKDDDFNTARGIVYACVISLLMWAVFVFGMLVL